MCEEQKKTETITKRVFSRERKGLTFCSKEMKSIKRNHKRQNGVSKKEKKELRNQGLKNKFKSTTHPLHITSHEMKEKQNRKRTD